MVEHGYVPQPDRATQHTSLRGRCLRRYVIVATGAVIRLKLTEEPVSVSLRCFLFNQISYKFMSPKKRLGTDHCVP